MERQGVDRVILSLYESQPDQEAFGKWSQSTPYYPFEMLNETEQEIIKSKKSYEVVALVRENVGRIVQYPEPGVEKYNRTHVHPMLPKLKTGSGLDYVTKGGIYIGEELKKFVQNGDESGWTPGIIREVIQNGIQEYHNITKRLMEKAGVYKTLEKMESRKYSPFEQIMLDIRKR